MFFIIMTVVAIVLGSVGFYFLSSYVLIKQPPIVLNILKLVFFVIVILAAYMNYSSINSKMELTDTVKMRRTAVKERLEYIKDAQIQYKKTRGVYANSFENLIDFLKNDSIVVVKMIGEVPDSLVGRESEALALGLIQRDTSKTPVRTMLFVENFNSIVDSIAYIPYGAGKQFNINAGAIVKNDAQAPVFMAYAMLTDIYQGLKTNNEGYDMTDSLSVGSMEELKTNGNWKD